MNINASLSGINNAFLREDVTARNLANVNTKDYKSTEVVNTENKNGGVSASVKMSKAKPNPANNNNVNLITETVNQINNVNQEKANINTLRAQNEMIGSVIDMKA